MLLLSSRPPKGEAAGCSGRYERTGRPTLGTKATHAAPLARTAARCCAASPSECRLGAGPGLGEAQRILATAYR